MDEKIKQEEQEEQERQQDKQKNKEFYRNLFYQKWGTYENYLNKCGKEINNERKTRRERKRELNNERRKKRRNLYLKVKGDNDNELWISPEGTRKEFFFTCKKTTMKAIKNFKWEDDKINKQISLF